MWLFLCPVAFNFTERCGELEIVLKQRISADLFYVSYNKMSESLVIIIIIIIIVMMMITFQLPIESIRHCCANWRCCKYSNKY